MTEMMQQSGERLDRLREAVFSSEVILTVLELLSGQTDHEFWVGAGAVAQTVWNFQTERPCEYGLHDIDLAYYNADDQSEESEQRVERELSETLNEVGIPLDVKNQARVHTWYARTFGDDISPYGSLREAIETWPTTATAVAIRLNGETGKLEVIAPFGLDDLLSLTVRPNRKQITQEIYAKYRRRWQSQWPELKIEEWES